MDDTNNKDEAIPVGLGDGKTDLGVSLPEGVKFDDIAERAREYQREGKSTREATLCAIEDSIEAFEGVEEVAEDVEDRR